MSTATTSFRDGGHTHLSFALQPMLVVCPRCANRAIFAAGWDKPGDEKSARLTCPHCGLARSAPAALRLQYDRDPVFGQKLWLTTQTRHGLLCCYHQAHLELFEGFASASLRERAFRHGHPNSGHDNKSYISRLPAWIKAAKNRQDMMRACARLRVRLQTQLETGDYDRRESRTCNR